MNNKKAYLQMSFAWIFAIIVGAFILFLAIYAVTKLIKTEETVQDLKAGKEIEILLNPLETSFETGRATSFIMPTESRIYNKCNNNGVFGRQLISVSQRSFNKWTETSIDGSKDVGSSNKYIFSDEYVEGRQFYVFSKPFEFPFKVADLIYMTSSKENYCFVDVDVLPDIKDEVKTIRQTQKNLFYENCSDSNMIEICFQDSGCDIDVYYDHNYVAKDNRRLDFETDALMYAAIFAEPDIYECQVNRLMKKIEQLAMLYDDKATIISQEAGCSSNLDLSVLASTAANSESISNLNPNVEDIKNKNKLAMCRLW